VVKQTLVFQIKFCGKSRALRNSANRYVPLNTPAKPAQKRKICTIKIRHLLLTLVTQININD
jgi:hypothetical protein